MFVCFLLLVPGVLAGNRIVIGGMDGIDPFLSDEPPQIKLALSGGGARGLGTVGILRAFEERNIKIAAITGTSIGGIIGGLYACGYSAAELTEILRDIDFRLFLSNQPARSSMFLTKRQGRERHLLSIRFDGIRPHIPQGFTTGQEVTALLTSLTNRTNYLAGGDFTRFPIPFKTVGTDVVSGEEIVFSEGSLADAMRATIAFPLAFTGVEIGSRLVMDGGMVTPVPVDIARRMGDTSLLVVAINTTSPLLTRDQLITPVDVAGQVTSIMTADKLSDQLSRADFVIEPCPDSFSTTDFRFRDSIVEIGYRVGLEAADSLLKLLKEDRDTSTYCISEVRVVTSNRELADKITATLLGSNFSRYQMRQELKLIVRDNDLFGLTADLQTVNIPEPAHTETERESLIEIEPQEQWRVSETTFEFTGNSVYNDSLLLAQFAFTDSLISPSDLKRGLDEIIARYHADGYDLAGVRDIEFNKTDKKIIITLDEAIVRRIDVRNNRRTKDWLVRSYFPIKRGSPYSTRKASTGIDNIYATDLFERVTLDLFPYDIGAILQIGVKEKKYTQLRFGWHWHDEYKSEQFMELLDDNIFGIGMEYLIHARTGHDRWRYQTDLRAHRIFSTYLTALIRLYHYRWDRAIFNGQGEELGSRRELRSGLLISIGQQIARLGTVSGGVSFEEIRQTDRRTDVEERFNLRSILLQSQLETFNRVPFPESGSKHNLEITIAGKALGGEVEFTRLFSSLEGYIPLGRNLNFHPKVSIGISRTGLPPSEQFYIGGLHSFSGFRTDQLAGDKFLLINQELRLKLPLHVYLFARYDVGEVYNSSDQIKLRNLRHGYCFSIALDTPIGPFEFGYGIVDSDTDRLYFNAGLAF